MKKVILVAAIGMLALVSCKKDYTCKCTISGGGVDGTTSSVINGTKNDAKDACEKGTATVGDLKTSCVIL